MTDEDISAELATVSYFLVLLRPGENHDEAARHFSAHIQFITRLEAAGSVLLGGSFGVPLNGAEGAYLLYAASRADAEALASRDPLVSTGAFSAEVVEWNLVGICTRAIDPSFTGEAR